MVISKQFITFGASVIGPGHIKHNKPNQDYFLIRNYKHGTVLTVSDGVGSCSLSHIGSKSACKAVCSIMHDYLNDNKVVDPKILVQLIHAKWLYEISPNFVKDCAATLLFAVISDDQIILARLGDGMIYLKTKDQKLLSEDDKNSAFSNMTKCLVYKFNYDDWNIQVIENKHDLDFILLCTDGISDDLLIDKKDDFCEQFAYEYAKEPNLVRVKRIKHMLNNWSVPKHTDDKTIVCYKTMDQNNDR